MVKTLAALIASLCIAFSAVAAQSKVETKKVARPAWTELTPAQQQVLAPLQAEWEQLDTTRRKKWIAIADRYRTMKPPEQERLQKRMQEWAKLTPAERKAAREKYQTLKKQPPQKRDEVKRRWHEYEQSRTAPPAGTPLPAPVTIQTPPGGG
jgi:Skp family chaperone for outer membrane proteins